MSVSEMSIKERMMAVYRGQPPDRMPVAGYARYLLRGQVEREARANGLGIIDYVPAISMLPPPWHMLDGYLSQIDCGDVTISYRWEKGKQIERRALTIDGQTLWSDLERDDAGAGSEHIIKHYIEKPEDYGILAKLLKKVVLADNGKLLAAHQRDLGEDGVVVARLDRSAYQKMLIELAGPETFFCDLAEDDGTIEEVLMLIQERELEAAERTFASKAEVVWLPDNVTCDMTPPRRFAHYCLPYYQKLMTWSRETGKPLLVHFDGKIKRLQEHIRASGITAIDSFSLPEMGGDMTLAEGREAFPGIGLLVNFPATFSYKSEAEIVAWTQAFTREAMTCQPAMLQISEDLPVSEWQKVARAMAQGALTA